MNNGAIFVQKSTVPVGTGQRIEDMFSKLNKQILYVSNPEFLREGTAVSDSLWFDRIVVGGNNKSAKKEVIGVYKQLESNRDKIAQIADLPKSNNSKGEYYSTNRNSAELIKVTSNAFLALKISFANSIAKLADQANADIIEVMDAVGADKRIGRDFLNAGRGYGGGCFPKDVSGLIASAEEHGVDLPIMTAATDVNETMPGYIANKLQDALGSLKNKKVAVIGLSFKSGTSDARKSPGVKIANILSRSGTLVNAFDPKALQEASEELRKNVQICESFEECLSGCDAVVVATAWPEFITRDIKDYKSLLSGKVLVDGENSLDKLAIEKAGLTYIGVGR